MESTNSPLSFSIIVPSYNQGNYIGSTLSSILDQRDVNAEVIVVDNMSVDKTEQILMKYNDRIHIVRERDHGQADAINKGLRKSHGNILAYLNSDDVYLPGALRIVEEYFRKNKEAVIVYGKGVFIDKSGKELGTYKTQEANEGSLYKECVISQPTVFFRRELLDTIGYFNEKLQLTMDYEYWIRVAKRYKFHFLDEKLAATRLYESTKTATQQEKVFRECLDVVYSQYGGVSDEAIFHYSYASYPLNDPKTLRKNILENINLALKMYRKYKKAPSVFLAKQILSMSRMYLTHSSSK